MRKIVGKQTVDYVSRKTHQQVNGITLHLTYEDESISGVGTETVFISSRSLCYTDVMALGLGTEIDVFYNRYGSVEDVRPLRKVPAK